MSREKFNHDPLTVLVYICQWYITYQSTFKYIDSILAVY